MTHSKFYTGTQYTHELNTPEIKAIKHCSSRQGVPNCLFHLLFLFNFQNDFTNHFRGTCNWKSMSSLTQGVRAALHRLVDLPCNSGHRLTHLSQHADTGVLLPATRLVCCSQVGLRLGKTQGCEVPAHQTGTHL